LTIYLESVAVSLQYLIESVNVSKTDSLGHLEVRSKSVSHSRLTENVPFRNITHQELNRNQELLHRLLETHCGMLRAFANGLKQVGMSLQY